MQRLNFNRDWTVKKVPRGLAASVPESEGHIGLLNTCLRLHYYSKGAVHMALMNDDGAVVRLTIEQPD